MFYIYILYSPTSDIFYIGYSANYKNRMNQHNSSEKDTFSKKHRPWLLKAVFEAGRDKSDVMRIEKFIKKQKSRTLIERMISDEPLYGQLAQLVRVPDFRD